MLRKFETGLSRAAVATGSQTENWAMQATAAEGSTETPAAAIERADPPTRSTEADWACFCFGIGKSRRRQRKQKRSDAEEKADENDRQKITIASRHFYSKLKHARFATTKTGSNCCMLGTAFLYNSHTCVNKMASPLIQDFKRKILYPWDLPVDSRFDFTKLIQ